MFLEAAIKPTYHALRIKIALIAIVLITLSVFGVVWWLLLLMVVCAMTLLWFDKARAIPVYEISVHHPNDVWYLGMYDENERQIWQAYLHDVTRAGRALKLSFHVIAPYERDYELIIYRDSLSDEDFRRLSTLLWIKSWV